MMQPESEKRGKDRRIRLASSSAARAELLRRAGVAFDVRPVAVDEAAVRESLLKEGGAVQDLALALAEMKARRAASGTDRLVIGADQILVCDGRVFAKPESLEEARAQLEKLRGKDHQLISAVCLARHGSLIWHHVGVARLYVRAFTDVFLQSYLERQGEAICHSVGAYQLEGEGVQLFHRIEGDYFTILGLPLIPLLNQLRVLGYLEE